MISSGEDILTHAWNGYKRKRGRIVRKKICYVGFLPHVKERMEGEEEKDYIV